jgi:hypothetical protein
MNKGMLRVAAQTHETIRAIAEGKGTTMQQVVEEAVEAYRRQMILDASNAAYARLLQSGEGREAAGELQAWDVTLADGLEDS